MTGRGLALLEVLIAMAVLAVVASGVVRLAGGATRAARLAAAQREASAWVRAELAVQRAVPAPRCVVPHVADGWRCAVERACLGSCDLEQVIVTVTPPVGAAVRATTAVWWPLERAELP